MNFSVAVFLSRHTLRADTAKRPPNREACGGLDGERANFRQDPTGKRWLQKNLVLKVEKNNFCVFVCVAFFWRLELCFGQLCTLLCFPVYHPSRLVFKKSTRQKNTRQQYKRGFYPLTTRFSWSQCLPEIGPFTIKVPTRFGVLFAVSARSAWS